MDQHQEPLDTRLDELSRLLRDLVLRVEALERQQQPGISQQGAAEKEEPPVAASRPPETPGYPAQPHVPGMPPIPPPPEVPPSEPPPPSAILVDETPGPAPEPGPEQETAVGPKPQPQAAPPPPPHPPPLQPTPVLESWQTHFERLVGGKASIYASALAIFFALGLFLKYSWDYLGDPGRLAIGYLAGAALIAAGFWARGRMERWFVEGVTGGGLALLYLTTWAGAETYNVIGFTFAFGLMALITAAGVALAVVYDALSLSILATAGGFITPALLGGDGAASAALPLLIYITVLNIGVLGVSLMKQWRAVVLLSFAGTILLLAGWASTSFDPQQHTWQVFWFLTLYFLLFIGASIFRSLLRRQNTASEDLLLLYLNTIVYSAAAYSLIHQRLGDYPGLFPLCLALFLGALACAVWKTVPSNLILRYSLGGAALLALTLAVPAQLHHSWIGVGWSVEAAVLLTLGYRFREPLFRIAGQVAWLIALFGVLWAIPLAEVMPRALFVNDRALPLLFWIASNMWIAWYGHCRQADARDEFVDAAGASAALGLAWLLSQETWQFFEWQAPGLAGEWISRLHFVLAIILAALGLLTFYVGRRLRFTAVKFSGLLVSLAAIALPVTGSANPAISQWAPFWNLRFASFAAVSAFSALLARMLVLDSSADDSGRDISPGVMVALSLLVLLGLSLESFSASLLAWRGPAEQADVAAWLVLVTLWSAITAGLYFVGSRYRQSVLMSEALLLGLAGGILVLMLGLDTGSLEWQPLFNLRAQAMLAVVGMGAAISLMAGRSSVGAADGISQTAPPLTALVALIGLLLELNAALQQWLPGNYVSRETVILFSLAAFAAIFSAVLLSLGRRWNLLGLAGLGAAALVLVALISAGAALMEPGTGLPPVLNMRFGAFLIISAAGLWGLQHLAELAKSDQAARSVTDYQGLLGIGSLGLVGYLLLGLTVETWETVRYYQTSFANWRLAGQIAISAVWTLYGFVLLIGGIVKDYQPLRLLALGVLAVVTAKVFLADMISVDAPYRIVSFLVLGLVLLRVSMHYSRSASRGAPSGS